MIGQRIKTLRINADLTQVELARLLAVSQSSVAMWEADKAAPRMNIVPKLAELLHCKIDDLFEEVETDDDRRDSGE